MRIASFSASCESGGATRNRGYIESFVATPSRKAKESLPQDDKRSGWGFTGLKAGAFTRMRAAELMDGCGEKPTAGPSTAPSTALRARPSASAHRDDKRGMGIYRPEGRSFHRDA